MVDINSIYSRGAGVKGVQGVLRMCGLVNLPESVFGLEGAPAALFFIREAVVD